MERLLAIIRRPQVLIALVSRRRRPFEAGVPQAEPFVDVPVALSQVHPATCPWKDKDLRAWRALGNVPKMSERAALAMVRILIGSVAHPDDAAASLPELDPDAPPRDLRPHLCVPDHEQQLLDSFAGALDEVTRTTEMPPWHWKRRGDIAALPAEFRRTMLWSLHLAPWERVLDLLAVWQVLELDSQSALRSGVARLLSLAGPERTLAWAGLLGSLEGQRRVRAADLILAAGAHEREPGDDDMSALADEPDQRALTALMKASGGTTDQRN